MTLHEATLHELLGELGAAEAGFARAERELAGATGVAISHAAALAGLGRAAWRRGDPRAEGTLAVVLTTSDALYGGAGPASARARLDLARARPGAARGDSTSGREVLAALKGVVALALLDDAASALAGEGAEPELLAEVLWEASSLEPDPLRADRLLEEARRVVAERVGARADGLLVDGIMVLARPRH